MPVKQVLDRNATPVRIWTDGHRRRLDHPEGPKRADATAFAAFLARQCCARC
jgi:hypothetical protein